MKRLTDEMPPLHLLETLLAYSEFQNMTKTAHQLGVSQPTVSLQLKQLEEFSDIPIFTTRGRSKELSQYGRALCEGLRTSLTAVPKIVRAINSRFAQPEQIEIRVGARKELFGELAYLTRFPGRVHFSDLDGREAVEWLLQRKIDLAISHESVDVHHIKRRKLFASGAKLLVHRKWIKRAIPEATDVTFLKRVPWLVYDAEAGFIRAWLAKLRLGDERLNLKVECQDWDFLLRLVEDGVGYCIFPETISHSHADLVAIAVPAAVIPARTFYLLYETSLAKHPVIGALLRAGPK